MADEEMQGMLFSDPTQIGTTRGYRGTVASKVAGITYRQLDYWARKQIVEPSLNQSHGSGTRRLYSFKDVMILAVSKKLLDAGVNLQNVTLAISYLSQRSINDLDHLTIMSDGEEVYECMTDEEILELVKTGKAVFGLSVSSLKAQVEELLENEEYIDLKEQVVSARTGRVIDELSALRMRKQLEQRQLERASVSA
jgi:DNA-binding transcriptional MerR regulator